MIFNLFKLIILWFFSFEKFEPKKYSANTIGHCVPHKKISNPCCWKKMTYEDCNLLNKNNFYCGHSNGKPIECIHLKGKLPKYCITKKNFCNQPYMIQVKSNEKISLKPKN